MKRTVCNVRERPRGGDAGESAAVDTGGGASGLGVLGDDRTGGAHGMHEDVDEEEDEFLDRADRFEHAYNFRCAARMLPAGRSYSAGPPAASGIGVQLYFGYRSVNAQFSVHECTALGRALAVPKRTLKKGPAYLNLEGVPQHIDYIAQWFEGRKSRKGLR